MPSGIRKLMKNIKLNDEKITKNDKQMTIPNDCNKSIEFKAELFWCQDFIRNEIDKCKNDRRKESLIKGYNILVNEKTSIIRKRQVMNQFCGDYRKQMNDDIVKVNSQPFAVKIQNMSKLIKSSTNEISYTFLRKHDKSSKTSRIFAQSTCDFKLDFLVN